ncbi:hypothetical protein TNCV_3318321 [Trichonephila clavipes]|nr:hypothetical protein TNCV_3318321 [Trichonephila clavipes]
MREPTKKSSREPSHPNRKFPITLRRVNNIISAFIDKYTIVNQKTESLGKPWEILTTGSPIPKHLDRAEPFAHFRLTFGHEFWEYTSTGLAWLLTRPAYFEDMLEWMETICSNALDWMNTQMTIL